MFIFIDQFENVIRCKLIMYTNHFAFQCIDFATTDFNLNSGSEFVNLTSPKKKLRDIKVIAI